MVVDSGASSTCIKQSDKKHVNVSEEDSPKVFYNANGTKSKAGKKAKLKYKLREPATDSDMVPDLAQNSLLSTSKMADANYITIFTPEEVQVFDGNDANFKVSGQVVMKGWRCPRTKLWRVPMVESWTNENTDTVLLSQEATDIIMQKRETLDPKEFINSVYELPNLEQVSWHGIMQQPGIQPRQHGSKPSRQDHMQPGHY